MQSIPKDDGADVWWLKIRALPDDVPAAVRMKRLLKLMLRSFGLKVEVVSGRGPEARGE